MVENTISLLNLLDNVEQGDGASYGDVSDDGRYIIFYTYIIQGGGLSEPPYRENTYYMYDLYTDTTSLLSFPFEIMPGSVRISNNGYYIVFNKNPLNDIYYRSDLYKLSRNTPANLLGGNGDDTLTGGMGADRLVGGSGTNLLTGEGGNDLYVVENTTTEIIERAGGGTDSLRASINITLPAYVENLIMQTGALNGSGNELNNQLWGNSADNLLQGGNGDDSLIGSEGIDTLVGGSGNDLYRVATATTVVQEDDQAGIDTIISQLDWTLTDNVENLQLAGQRVVNLRVLQGKRYLLQSQIGSQNLNGTGNGLDNQLRGNYGDNNLIGGDGNDALYGGQGNDTLQGGNGADIFQFFSPDDGVDLLNDFSVEEGDKLSLEYSRFGQLNAVESGHFVANVAGQASTTQQRFIYNTTTRQLSFDSDGSGSASSQVLLTFSSAIDLTYGDLSVFHATDLPFNFENVDFSVEELSVAGALVGNLTVFGQDGDDLTFSLLSGGSGNALFSVNADGRITVREGVILDFETRSRHSLHVQATDGISLVDAVVTIEITDAQDTFSLLLDESNSLRVLGAGYYYNSCVDVSFSQFRVLGDYNNDGMDDLLFSRPLELINNIDFVGTAFLVFGQSVLPPSILLPEQNTDTIWRITGNASYDWCGDGLSQGGDVNGDGYDDFILNIPGSNAGSGAVYVIFGTNSAPVSSLSELDGANGFRFVGGESRATSQATIIGDINGDGYDDMMIPEWSNPNYYEAHVVFGHAQPFVDTYDLSDPYAVLDGFYVQVDVDSYEGARMLAAGDINGDGYGDVLLKAPENYGPCYVIFGHGGTFGNIQLSELNGDNGFQINVNSQEGSYYDAIAAIGDINGDGYDDLSVTNCFNNGTFQNSYVIFGKGSGFSPSLDMASLNGENGFAISRQSNSIWPARPVSSAGDFNGDGFADLIIGDNTWDNFNTYSGSSYILFGHSGTFDATMDLHGPYGLALRGALYSGSGRNVAGRGDFNGDGFDDVIVGDRSNNAYVVFGSDQYGPVAEAGTSTGSSAADRLTGSSQSDILIGNGGADVLYSGAGDDEIQITDTTFFRIDGGSGTDTLYLYAAGMNLDLTSIADSRLHNVEVIDVTGTGNNTLTLSRLEVVNLMGANRPLVVLGDQGDSLAFADSGWQSKG
ncbi:MAG: FG-GAP repeat protein, partial [Magnetococcales bacterium]|nr:FG-GAP repeat protein [Magnetococcales bacterium]